MAAIAAPIHRVSRILRAIGKRVHERGLRDDGTPGRHPRAAPGTGTQDPARGTLAPIQDHANYARRLTIEAGTDL